MIDFNFEDQTRGKKNISRNYQTFSEGDEEEDVKFIKILQEKIIDLIREKQIEVKD